MLRPEQLPRAIQRLFTHRPRLRYGEQRSNHLGEAEKGLRLT